MASPKQIIKGDDRKVKVTLWVPSQLDSKNDATHVFVHTNKSDCTRYTGVPLLLEASMDITLAPYEDLYAITEDQALLAVSTETL